MGENSSSVGNDLPHQSSMWNDLTFDDIRLNFACLPFNEDFSGDDKSICNNAPHKLSNLKENHLSRVLLMEQIKREKHTITVNELKSNLSTF